MTKRLCKNYTAPSLEFMLQLLFGSRFTARLDHLMGSFNSSDKDWNEDVLEGMTSASAEYERDETRLRVIGGIVALGISEFLLVLWNEVAALHAVFDLLARSHKDVDGQLHARLPALGISFQHVPFDICDQWKGDQKR